MKNLVDRHVFVVNPQDNGGESLTLTTEFFTNEDGGVFATQELSLQSYGNSAGFNLLGALLTPEKLREIASQLNQVRRRANATAASAAPAA